MKKTLTLLALLFFALNISFAQLTTVLGGLTDYPNRLFAVGNDLYFVEATAHKVSKIDVSANPIIPIEAVWVFGNIGSMALYGNDLYFTNSSEHKVSKFEITSSSPTVVDVIDSGLLQPNGLLIIGNDLYISDSGYGKIFKADLTNSSPTLMTIVDSLRFPTAMALKGNDLYVSEIGLNRISKIDISSSSPTRVDVITGLGRPLGIVFRGNILYIAERSNNRISKIDISLSLPVREDVVATGLVGPMDIVFIGHDLYIAEYDGFKISKLPNVALAQDEPITQNIRLYPNPSVDFISIAGIQRTMDYQIYSITGARVMEGNLRVDERIDVGRLDAGLYLLRSAEGWVGRFRKE